MCLKGRNRPMRVLIAACCAVFFPVELKKTGFASRFLMKIIVKILLKKQKYFKMRGIRHVWQGVCIR